MNFLDLNLKPEYRSFRDDVIKNFLCPVLKRTVVYKRAVGSFSASALFALRDGICELIENGGKIQIIASAKDLLAHDIETIDEGLRLCDEVNENDLIRALKTSRDSFNFLRDLIASGRLEFKIAKLENSDGIGMFHEKLGLMYDAENNVIAFSGSMNESFNAFKNNYESIDVFTSWTNDADRVKAKEVAFDSLWNNREHGVKVIALEKNFRVEKFLVKADDNDQSSYEITTQLATDVYQRTTKLSKTKDLTGVSTGLWDLNKLTNGLQRGELILLAACPSMGKTALALNIAQGAANAKKVVIVFSLEMSKRQIAIRILSALSNVEATKIATGQNLCERDYEYMLGAIEDMERHPFYVDDTSGLTVAAMRMKLRRFKQEHGLDFVVVDYLQLMRGNGENRVQEISEISRGLKSLAKEFDVPVLALSQLSRNVEMRAEKKPQLSDLRDSGSLEQDADIVMFLYRDEYYNPDDEENKNLAELIVAKNRNGSTAALTLFFQKETMQFTDFVEFLPPEQEDEQ